MEFYVGQKACINRLITEELVNQFAEVSGDYNPVHIDEDVAKNSIFGRKIAHGALVSSFISTVLGMHLPGSGTIYLKQESKFLKPVYINDVVTATAEIVEINEKHNAIIKTIVTNQDDVVVIDGEAIVKLPKKS